MPFTSNKLLSVQSAGSNAGVWGTGASDSLNEGVFEKLDDMLGGITSKSLTNVDVDLTQAEAQNAMLRLTGTLTGNVDISPDVGVTMIGFYYWENLTSGSFSVTFTNSAGSVTLPQSRRGVMWIDETNGPRIVSIVGSSTAETIPATYGVAFYNASVPAGWTAVAMNDRAIRIVTNGGGGSIAGSVAFSTLFARTATDSHTLTLSQIPNHQHDYTVPSLTATVGSGANNAATTTGTTQTTAAGGGAGHAHNIDMRVQYANMVVGTRN